MSDQSAPTLYLIPLFGLGATLIHVHHNGIIGALGVYLGVELHQDLRQLFALQGSSPRPVFPPRDWDSSETLRSTRRRPSQRRLVAGMLILELPQIGALVLAAAELPTSAVSVVGLTIGAVAAAASGWMLVASDRDRRENMRRIRTSHSSIQAAAAAPVSVDE